MKKYSVHELVLTSLFIALVYIFTWLIKIQLPFAPQGGLIHLGNVPFFIACIFFGRRVGMISGALGMTLFDLTSGWVAWAPITFITTLVMGYVLGSVSKRELTVPKLIPAMLALAIIKMIGYYLGECVIFKSFLVPIASIPGNLLQILVSTIIVLVMLNPFKRILSSAGLY